MKVEGILVKPCWFCKGTNILMLRPDSMGLHTLECQDCKTRLTTYDKYKLIDKWNEKYDRAYKL